MYRLKNQTYCILAMAYWQSNILAVQQSYPLFRGFWDEKIRSQKPRNRGDREIRGQLIFTVMTQITDLNDNISCDNASLHFKTSQYASIYSLEQFYESKTILEVKKVPKNSLKLVGNQ